MDSSYGKNAPNRVEESYGDAKNLRLRHPLAALGFVLGLRSDILEREPNVAAWIFDLLGKLGQEDDAYDATCLVLMEYAGKVAAPLAEPREDAAPIAALGVLADAEGEDRPAPIPTRELDDVIDRLPRVKVLEQRAHPELSPARFLRVMVTRVLRATPVNMHAEARRRMREPAPFREGKPGPA